MPADRGRRAGDEAGDEKVRVAQSHRELLGGASARAPRHRHLTRGDAHEFKAGLRSGAPSAQPCSDSYFAISSSGLSTKSGFCTMQSAGQTSLHWGSSSAPTHSVHLSALMT